MGKANAAVRTLLANENYAGAAQGFSGAALGADMVNVFRSTTPTTATYTKANTVSR